MADELPVPSRDEVAAGYKRSYRLRLPEADVRNGMQPDTQARSAADMLMPVYARAQALANTALLNRRVGSQIDAVGELELVYRAAAVGASGYVEARTSTGGGWILAGDEIKDTSQGWRYQCAASKLYLNGEDVPIVGVDTGPSTNQAAGVVLQWSSPRSGVLPLASVVEDGNGAGLTGGRDTQTDEEYIDAIIEARRRRANAGNDAEYQRVIKDTPGVRVEQAFTYPAIFGPGTIAWCFTVKPSYPGGSRVPNAAQIALVDAYLAGMMPADDCAIGCILDGVGVTICVGMRWDENSVGWANSRPWPDYAAYGAVPGPVIVGTVTSSTVFQLTATSYSGIRQPSAGTVLGIYDYATAMFRRKQIKSFTGTGPWVVTCETDASSSDTSYIPGAAQRVCPWSDDLQLLVPTITGYIDAMGPGEQVATLPGDGRKQARSPRVAAKRWPIDIGNRSVDPLTQLASVGDASLLYSSQTTVPVGTAGVKSNILYLWTLAVYPEP